MIKGNDWKSEGTLWNIEEKERFKGNEGRFQEDSRGIKEG